MKSKKIIFNIDKCIDPKDQPGYCKKDQEIDDFIYEMSVQLWMIDSQIDMRYFHGKSEVRNQKLVTENMIRVKDEIP